MTVKDCRSALKENFDAFAKMLVSAVNGGADASPSTIRVQPTLEPPVLGDGGESGREAEGPFDRPDDVRSLANEGTVTSPMERSQTLGTCLEGTERKIYILLVDKYQKLGSFERDPDGIPEVVKGMI